MTRAVLAMLAGALQAPTAGGAPRAEGSGAQFAPAPPDTTAASAPERVANPARVDGDGVSASAGLDRGSTEVGRPIVYRIELRGEDAAIARIGLDAFREAAAVGDPFAFDLLESTPLRRDEAGPGDPAVWSMTLVLATLDAGLATPPPLAIAWRSGGAERRVELPLPSVEVASLAGGDAQPGDFRGIAGALEPDDDAGAWWLWPLGAFALTTAAAGAAAFWMSRDRAPVPADRRALAALEALAARDLPGRREFGAFADELVGIVRAFVIERFAIPADRRTTRELLAHLGDQAGVAATEADRLRALLALADRVKFARTEPDPAECAAHLLDARRFVEACSPAANDAAPAAGRDREGGPA